MSKEHDLYLNTGKNSFDVRKVGKSRIISFLIDRYNLAFFIVLFLSVGIRLKYFHMESIWNDAAVHLWYTIKVLKEPLFLFSPDYILGDYTIPQTITALFYIFTKNIFIAGKLMALFYSVLGILFIYLLGTELRDKFTGLMAAILLGFNHIMWFYGVRPLGDSPLTVVVIMLTYFMVKLEKEKKMIWGILTGSFFIVAVLHKMQAVILIMALIIYYIIFKNKVLIKDKAVLVSWLIPIGVVAVGDIMARILTGSSPIMRVIYLFGALRGLPFGFEALGQIKWIATSYMFYLILVGIILVILYRDKKYYFSLVLLVFYWLFFEVNVDNTLDRYMLPILPLCILFAVYALNEIGHYTSLFTKRRMKYIFVLSVVIFIGINFYKTGDGLIGRLSYGYTGYQEAGQWLKENVPEDVPIFAGSPRSIRAFVGRELYSYGVDDPREDTFFGGTVWYLRGTKYLENKTAFEEDLHTLNKKSDVYVEIDVWEYTQPSWYFPITQNSINYFIGLGFYPVKVVEREVNTQNLQKIPVIFLFKKDKEPGVGNETEA